MRIKSILLLIVFFLQVQGWLCPRSHVSAPLISVDINATVTTVSGFSGVKTGDIIDGYYVYNPTLNPSSNGTGFAFYQMGGSSPVLGFHLELRGTIIAESNGSSINFKVEVQNNYGGDDGLLLDSYNNNVSAVLGVTPDLIEWALADSTESVFNSTSLPVTAPNISRFQTQNALSILTYSPSASIYATVNTAILTPPNVCPVFTTGTTATTATTGKKTTTTSITTGTTGTTASTGSTGTTAATTAVRLITTGSTGTTATTGTTGIFHISIPDNSGDHRLSVGLIFAFQCVLFIVFS